MSNKPLTPDDTPTFDIRLMNAMATLLFVAVVAVGVAGMLWKVSRLPVFSLTGLQVQGQPQHTTAGMLREQVLPQLKGNFFSVNLAQTREAFMQLPWVRSVVVHRVFPNQLAVQLEEHEAAAYWGADDNNLRLLNRQGEVFEGDPDEVTQEGLPRLSGPDAQSAEVLLTYRRLTPLFKPLDAHITALDLDPRGNWQLVLNDNLTITIGAGTEQELAARIRQFVETVGPVTERYQRTFADLEYVDLRYKTGYALRMKGVTTVNNTAAEGAAKTKPKT